MDDDADELVSPRRDDRRLFFDVAMSKSSTSSEGRPVCGEDVTKSACSWREEEGREGKEIGREEVREDETTGATVSLARSAGGRLGEEEQTGLR